MKPRSKSSPPCRRLLPALLLLTGLFVPPLWAQETVPDSPEKVHPLLIGMEIPDVAFRKADGSEVSLRQLAGQKPMVMIYYRGGW